ncbi:MAG: c-type cytochrome [Pseudomonadota bacterium]
MASLYVQRGLALVAVALMMVAIESAEAQDDRFGAEEFRVSCAFCHGLNGRGSGPLAMFLTIEPADLTTIARRNGGVFPTDAVFEIIDGRTAIATHGDRQMPAWGDRYKTELEEKNGADDSEAAARAKIQSLVAYLETIQKNW